MKRLSFCALALASAALVLAQTRGSYGPGRIWWEGGQGGFLAREEDYENPDGDIGVSNLTGAVRADEHAFFDALGENGRACITCHQPSNAMSVSAAAIRQRWTETDGKSPIFAAVDGSNCPSLPQNEMASHSLALERGLFRIALRWPPKAVKPDFKLEVVSDPTGCNLDPVYGLKSPAQSVSVFRRPRMVANFGLLTEAADGLPRGMRLMADGREATLRSQAITAALTHEQALTPTDRQLAQILAFERQIFAAQRADIRGGLLDESAGPSAFGPDNLIAGKASIFGIGAPILAAGWVDRPGVPVEGIQKSFRQSVVRGSEMFVRDCAACHNPRTASRAVAIGTTNHALQEASPDLPLFKVTCATGTVIYTQDPGRALVTGRCADTGAIVPQQLRGLAARAPYFANGSAQTLRDVVDFYQRRYSLAYSSTQREDLVNFLKTL